MKSSDTYTIIGIDEYGNRRQICVEESKEKAQNFIDSQRVDHTFVTYNGHKSNFSHNHILRGYMDAVVEPTDILNKTLNQWKNSLHKGHKMKIKMDIMLIEIRNLDKPISYPYS